jgi:hypothetical protein
MDNHLSPERLAELSAANFPAAAMRDIGLTLTADAEDIAEAERLAKRIDEYLSDFAKPILSTGGAAFVSGSTKCLCCGESLDGMLGTFVFGVAWGEGRCGRCGWPCRALHSIKDDDGDIFESPLQIVLQYHPSRVTLPAEAVA